MTTLVPLSDKELDIINLLFCERWGSIPNVPREVQELYEKLLEVRYGSPSSQEGCTEGKCF